MRIEFGKLCLFVDDRIIKSTVVELGFPSYFFLLSSDNGLKLKHWWMESLFLAHLLPVLWLFLTDGTSILFRFSPPLLPALARVPGKWHLYDSMEWIHLRANPDHNCHFDSDWFKQEKGKPMILEQNSSDSWKWFLPNKRNGRGPILSHFLTVGLPFDDPGPRTGALL